MEIGQLRTGKAPHRRCFGAQTKTRREADAAPRTGSMRDAASTPRRAFAAGEGRKCRGTATPVFVGGHSDVLYSHSATGTPNRQYQNCRMFPDYKYWKNAPRRHGN